MPPPPRVYLPSMLSCRAFCTASSVATTECSSHFSPLLLLRIFISRSLPRRDAKCGISMTIRLENSKNTAFKYMQLCILRSQVFFNDNFHPHGIDDWMDTDKTKIFLNSNIHQGIVTMLSSQKNVNRVWRYVKLCS